MLLLVLVLIIHVLVLLAAAGQQRVGEARDEPQAVHRPAHVQAQPHSRKELDEGHDHLGREGEVALRRTQHRTCSMRLGAASSANECCDHLSREREVARNGKNVNAFV